MPWSCKLCLPASQRAVTIPSHHILIYHLWDSPLLEKLLPSTGLVLVLTRIRGQPTGRLSPNHCIDSSGTRYGAGWFCLPGVLIVFISKPNGRLASLMVSYLLCIYTFRVNRTTLHSAIPAPRLNWNLGQYVNSGTLSVSRSKMGFASLIIRSVCLLSYLALRFFLSRCCPDFAVRRVLHPVIL